MNNLSATTNTSKIKYKIVLLGDQSVGKSSIIEKFMHNKFDESMNPTVGIDFLAKNLVYKSKSYRLQLWDTAGQERFKSLIPSYLKDAICAIIVYDVANPQSLRNAEKWLNIYNESKPANGYSILVGNKIDLEYRSVSKEEGEQVAESLEIDYFQLSAKSGKNVESLFFHLIDMFNEGKSNGTNNILDNIKEVPEETKHQENAIDEMKQRNGAKEQSSELIPQSKLDSIHQLHQSSQIKNQGQNQNSLQPKVQGTIVLRNEQIPQYPQARGGCC